MALYNQDPSLPKPSGAPRRVEGGARKSKARASVFLTIALVAGIAAAWLITQTLAERSRMREFPMTKVAVAAMDLPPATTVIPEMVAWVEWPTNALPAGNFSEDTMKSLEGRVTGREIAKGEPILEGRLAGSGTGQGMAAIIPATHRAMAVMVNDVIGVAGFIHPNDVVDVLTTMQTSPGSNDIRSKIVLQNIRVMAVGEEMVTQNAKPMKVTAVTLLVTPEESEVLALASTQGKIQLTLRSRADAEQVPTTGISMPEIFGKDTKVAAKAGPGKPKAGAKAEVKPEPEVVEVLHGDHFEEKKMRPKDNQ